MTIKDILIMAAITTAALVGLGIALKLYWRIFLFGWGLV